MLFRSVVNWYGFQAPGATPAPIVGKINAEMLRMLKDADVLELFRARLRGAPGFVDSGDRIGCIDPNGLALRVQVTRKRPVQVDCARTNTWNERARVDQASPAYERAIPIEVGHVVFFVADLAATTAFYVDRLGFVLSDSYPGRGSFLRCAPRAD